MKDFHKKVFAKWIHDSDQMDNRKTKPLEAAKKYIALPLREARVRTNFQFSSSAVTDGMIKRNIRFSSKLKGRKSNGRQRHRTGPVPPFTVPP